MNWITLLLVMVLSACTLQTKVPVEAKKATFAGGCFWCLEGPFEQENGVLDVVAGYAGGTKPNPTYDEVSSGTTDYVEAVQITYDPSIISYERLVEIFWWQIDPTDVNGQFADRGPQYQTVIFFHDKEQEQIAYASKKALAQSGKFDAPIATLVKPYTTFYEAESYHQDYYKKNPIHYNLYKKGSGRAGFIEDKWS